MKFRRHILRLSSQQNSNLFSTHTSNYKKKNARAITGLGQAVGTTINAAWGGGPEQNLAWKFSIFKHLQIGSGAHPASTSTDTGIFFRGVAVGV